jgi:hypothetical protein
MQFSVLLARELVKKNGRKDEIAFALCRAGEPARASTAYRASKHA